MSRYFRDDVYSRVQAGGQLEIPRQPRSPLREVHTIQPSEARDKSTSSSEKRSSSLKRNSLFSKRPKSAVSSTSNHTGTGEASRRSSANADVPVVPSESDTSRSRFLFGRSRKSKSGGSKARAASPLDFDDGERAERSEWRHRRENSEGRGMRISAPFGFQHVANIKKEREEPRDLFADFRALRRGHRAAIIGPSREPEPKEPEVEVKPQKRPAPLRPKRSDELLADQQLLSPQAFGMQPLRQIRSAETFSTGMPSSPMLLLPPRTSSHAAPKRPSHRPPPLNPALFLPSTNYNVTQTSSQSLSDEWDRLLPLYDNRAPSNPAEIINGTIRSIPLPDPAPDQLRSPMFNPPLEQVLEEPEGTLSNRHSKDLTQHPSIRHARSSPMLSRDNSKASRSNYPKLPRTAQFANRPMSQGSDTLGDPTRILDGPQSPRDVVEEQRIETPKSDLDITGRGTSWEDDIDYCYEHAAEADCDFDWNNVSRYEESDGEDIYRDDELFSYAEQEKVISKNNSMGSTTSCTEGDQYRLPNRVYKVPSKDALPELEYRSSHSTSTNSVAILTPLDKFSFPSSDSIRPNSQSRRISSKDAASSALLFLDFKSDPSLNQIYDDILPRADSTPPAIPVRSESRNERAVGNDYMKRTVAFPLLPTPPPSADQSPIISRSVENERPQHDLHINTIIAQLRRPLDSPVSPEHPPPPPPKSPHNFVRRAEDDVPQLVTRKRSNTLNTAKGKLFDAQTQLQEWSAMSLPRNNSETSVLTAIPISKPPTPPINSPYVGAGAAGMSFLSTPSPNLTQGSAYFLPPTSMTSPTPGQDPERPQMHRKVSSDGGARIVTPPMSPPIPRSSSSATSRSTSSNYSLFPQQPKQSPRPFNLRSPKSQNFATALRSPPLTGSFPLSPFAAQFEGPTAGPPTPPKPFRPRDRRLATA